MTLFWPELQKPGNPVPATPTPPRKPKKKKKKKRKRKRRKRKKTYLLEGAPVESFAPQERRTPWMPSLSLREGASPQLRRGAMTAPRVCVRLGAPFTTMCAGTACM